MKNFFLKNKSLLCCCVILIIYLSPNIFFPHKAKYLIHDNLDSNVIWYKNLAESGKIFSANHEIISRSLGGIERGCYPSEFNFIIWLYFFFSPLFAYNINIILIHLVAFISMYFFSRKYLFKQQHDSYALFTGLLFSLTPFWPSGMLSIAGQPLLLYAFLNILFHNENNWKNWTIIILFPFFSSLLYSNLFFAILLFAGGFVYTVKSKKINIYFFLALALFSFIAVITDYRLFTMEFIDHFEAQRQQLTENPGTLNLKGLIGVSFLLFLKGQYHFYGTQFPFGLLLTIPALIVGDKKNKIVIVLLFVVGYLLAFTSMAPALKSLPIAKYLNSINLRFYGLLPLLWFCVIGYSASILLTGKSQYSYIVLGSFLLMGINSLTSFYSKDYQGGGDYVKNSFSKTILNNKTPGHATFEEYYRIKDFDKIKTKIVPGDYYIVCLGFVPEIAQFNGYNTQGGYYVYYSKKYAELVYSIQEKEFKKLGKKNVQKRCYFESAELKNNIIKNLDWDFKKLKEIGTKYVFSIRRIENESLSLKEEFPEQGIYVYSIL